MGRAVTSASAGACCTGTVNGSSAGLVQAARVVHMQLGQRLAGLHALTQPVREHQPHAGVYLVVEALALCAQRH